MLLGDCAPQRSWRASKCKRVTQTQTRNDGEHKQRRWSNGKNDSCCGRAHSLPLVCRCSFLLHAQYSMGSIFDGISLFALSLSLLLFVHLYTIYIRSFFGLLFLFSLCQSNLSNKFDIYCEYPFCFVSDRNVAMNRVYGEHQISCGARAQFFLLF